MSLKTNCGDLHIHSTISDGTSSIAELFSYAKDAGLSYISITDHDFLPDSKRDVDLSCKYDITQITGVELSSMDESRHRRVHILCYFPVLTDELQKICKSTVKNRMAAGVEMTRLVGEKYPITLDEVLCAAGQAKNIFKQHIIQALKKKGFTDRIYSKLYYELFDTRTGSCSIECIQPEVMSIIAAVKRSGGICVMAHPHTYNGIEFLHEALSQKLLDGIEVWSSKTNEAQESELLALAREYDVIPTGGTDFHGENSKGEFSVGSKTTPAESMERLLCLHKKRVAVFSNTSKGE